MTDREKLLCTLLGEDEAGAVAGLRHVMSPLQVVSILVGVRELAPEVAV